MRTLQEKYNAIQEGKFSKEHFLAEARMQQPQLVTRFNGYDDTVQILKNKGMIVETKKEEAVKEDYSRVLELPDGNYFAIDGDWEDQYQGNNGLFFTVEGNSVYDKNGQAIQSSPREFISQFAPEEILKVESVNEAKQTKLTKKSLTDYRYKPTNEMDKYPYEQILRGIRVELEVLGVNGTPTAEEYSKALVKVSKNLAKDSIFYTNQVAGVNPKVDQHDQMVTATAKNTVDTFNGMKKAELKEGFKKLIKKVLSEEVMDVESYKEDEVYEMYGEDNVDESAMGDIYQIAQEHDRFEHFVQAVEDEFGPVEDIAELEHIFNATRGEDDIDYGDENFSDAEIDTEYEGDPGYQGYESPSDRAMKSDAWVQAQQDMMEGIDTEADKNMVRKLMDMYETDPAKFERLHKQAKVQASTTQDIKHKHLLSLIDRAKAGALQRATPEIPGFEGTRDALDNLFESKSLKDLI
jgi:hypothetical protein